MSGPVRVQLSRAKGWRMPENTVPVARPGPWGNPFNFRPGNCCWLALGYGCRGDAAGRQEASVKAFREWIDPGEGQRVLEMERGVTFGREGDKHKKIDIGPRFVVGAAPTHGEIRSALRGKNLACWCRLDQPCDADVLLELANRPICEAVP